MTHAAMDEAAQVEAGITPRLLRVSVGIEELDDLLTDLIQAFEKVSSNSTTVDKEVSNG